MPGLVAVSRRRLTPLNTGAARWFDPWDLSTVAQLSDGTVSPVFDDPVGRVMDKSGNAAHAVQATAGVRPTLKQDSAGLIYLDTVAASSQTIIAPWAPTAYPITMMFAGRMTTATTSGALSLVEISSKYKCISEVSGGVQANANDRNASNLTVAANSTINTNIVVTAVFEAAQMSVQVNRGTPATLANTNAFGLPVELRLGSLRSGGPFSTVRCYGWATWAGLLSASDKIAMQSFFAGRAGVAL